MTLLLSSLVSYSNSAHFYILTQHCQGSTGNHRGYSPGAAGRMRGADRAVPDDASDRAMQEPTRDTNTPSMIFELDGVHLQFSISGEKKNTDFYFMQIYEKTLPWREALRASYLRCQALGSASLSACTSRGARERLGPVISAATTRCWSPAEEDLPPNTLSTRTNENLSTALNEEPHPYTTSFPSPKESFCPGSLHAKFYLLLFFKGEKTNRCGITPLRGIK